MTTFGEFSRNAQTQIDKVGKQSPECVFWMFYSH